MSRNFRLSSEVELMAIMQRMRSPRSEMRDAESAHRTNHCARVAGVAPSNVRARPKADAANGRQSTDGADAASRAPIYPLVGLCRAAGLPEPVPEYSFARAIGRFWRFDYAWPLHLLALEIEGGLWTHGRHSRGSGAVADLEKYSEAAIAGWRLIYATPQEVTAGVAMDRVRRALASVKGST